MGIQIEVVGACAPDEEWHKLAAVWRACKEAEIEVPEKVQRFFYGLDPDELDNCTLLSIDRAINRQKNNDVENVYVDIGKLPGCISSIHFRARVDADETEAGSN